jgi:hypothetical protein
MPGYDGGYTPFSGGATYGMPGSSGGGGQNEAAMLGLLGIGARSLGGFGGGTAGRAGTGNLIGGFTGILKNFKGGLGGFTRGPGKGDMAGGNGLDTSDSPGKITGVNGMAGAALSGGGMMLAQAGLLGNNRGTVGGMFEGMAGGAMVGMQQGGPIGAAIGAGVGLTIGAVELVGGMVSPRTKAKRLVQQIYHISINNSTADQIVAIANQSYAKNVQLAVSSPEVRHMLGLYAAGTGQASKFPAGFNEAHGASLVESGGVLSQQATYQYGNTYSYNSSLPIYGGQSTQTLGAPGGNTMSLSLNIGGQDAAKFMQGNVVSPDVISTQYSAAMQGSNGRVPQALMMSEPGSIAS